MKKVFAILAVAGFMASCNSGENNTATADSLAKAASADSAAKAAMDTAKAAMDTAKAAMDTATKK
jgi:hypothetical protein